MWSGAVLEFLLFVISAEFQTFERAEGFVNHGCFSTELKGKHILEQHELLCCVLISSGVKES